MASASLSDLRTADLVRQVATLPQMLDAFPDFVACTIVVDANQIATAQTTNQLVALQVYVTAPILTFATLQAQAHVKMVIDVAKEMTRQI
jgi:hypothetical protein